jgi:putative sterol carrier protein
MNAHARGNNGLDSNVRSWVTSEVRRAAFALPEDVAVTFELVGPGGGTWTLTRTGRGVELREGRAAVVDTALRCPVSRFWDLVDGRVDPLRAFLHGEVELEGDVGLLLRLQGALRS